MCPARKNAGASGGDHGRRVVAFGDRWGMAERGGLVGQGQGTRAAIQGDDHEDRAADHSRARIKLIVRVHSHVQKTYTSVTLTIAISFHRVFGKSEGGRKSIIQQPKPTPTSNFPLLLRKRIALDKFHLNTDGIKRRRVAHVRKFF